MAVSQRFIDLLNLPAGQLEALAERVGIEIPRGTKKWDAARQLAHLSRVDLERHGGGYLYAGSTSISFIRLVPKVEPGTGGDEEQTARAPLALRAAGVAKNDVERCVPFPTPTPSTRKRRPKSQIALL